MAPRATLEDGDIAIRQDAPHGAVVYVLNAAPSVDQYAASACEAAVAQAVVFAKRQHVRVWLTDAECDFVLLEDCRVVESV